LAKDTPFILSNKCLEGFYKMKEATIISLIIQWPNWSLPFEIMYDASDYATGVVLRQRRDKKPYVIYHAKKMLDEAQ